MVRHSAGALLVAACGVTMLLVAASLGPSAAPARVPPTGQTRVRADNVAVLDGGTLRIGEQVVQLAGIVAPARGSLCHGADYADVDCAWAAANALAELVHGRSVACTVNGHDNHGRPIGACMVEGRPLSAALVRDGWASAAAADLQETEATARAAGLGVWRRGS